MDGPANASINSVGSNCGWRLDVLRSISAEPVSMNEHPWLLPEDAHPVVYVWFVPSPSMHITQGITKTHCINKLLKAGFTVKILLADWFSQMDPKIGTDLNKIQNIGLYNIEVWRAVGMDIEKVEFLWLSHVINFHGSSIWNIVMDIGEANTKKIKRCSWKTATEDGIEVPLPWLQCATILYHEAVDIWLLDGDQKDVSVLAEKYWKDTKRAIKPIVLLNNVLPDLLEASDFSERSDPSRAISMEDKERHIHFKIMVRAFCPPKVAKGNPCLAYIEYVIFPWFGKIEIVCGKDGAKRTRTFTSMESLVAAYKCGTLHHTDVKYALVRALNKMLQPVRDHFEKNTFALGLLKICAGILYGE